MKIINDTHFTRSDFVMPSVTIGSYDGLHLGHQDIFRRVKERAASWTGQAVVLTFNPHPAQVFRLDTPLQFITPYPLKMELLASLGIDVTVNLPFTPDIYQMSAEEFVREIIYRKIGPRMLAVGFNFTFGRGREGRAEDLKRLADPLGMEVDIVPPFRRGGEIISSTLIRQLIKDGDIAKANRMLGRPFMMLGTVVSGHGRGKILGYPTANLTLGTQIRPKTGVYAVRVHLGDDIYGGVMNIGTKPTFGDHDLAIEVFLLDFQGDLYLQELRVSVFDRLRDERHFPSPGDLVQQIDVDIRRAKEILRT